MAASLKRLTCNYSDNYPMVDPSSSLDQSLYSTNDFCLDHIFLLFQAVNHYLTLQTKLFLLPSVLFFFPKHKK